MMYTWLPYLFRGVVQNTLSGLHAASPHSVQAPAHDKNPPCLSLMHNHNFRVKHDPLGKEGGLLHGAVAAANHCDRLRGMHARVS